MPCSASDRGRINLSAIAGQIVGAYVHVSEPYVGIERVQLAIVMSATRMSGGEPT